MVSTTHTKPVRGFAGWEKAAFIAAPIAVLAGVALAVDWFLIPTTDNRTTVLLTWVFTAINVTLLHRFHRSIRT